LGDIISQMIKTLSGDGVFRGVVVKEARIVGVVVPELEETWKALVVPVYLLPVFPDLARCEMGDLVWFALTVATWIETVAGFVTLTFFERED